jgi:putative hydrolase of the HAD superfamily
LFDLVIESSVVGARKPEPRFYQVALEQLQIEPSQAVYLDDLGINLKPARAMGMRTIKVGDPDAAIDELQKMVGLPLRG